MDIVERLRMKARGQRNSIGDHWGDHICSEAADEIERLRKRLTDVDDLLTIAYLQGAADAKRGS